MSATVKKALSLSLLFIVLALVGSLAFVRWIGAWHLLFPSQAHEAVAPDVPGELVSPALLVFTKTNGFRHIEGIDAGAELLESLSAQRGWFFYRTENSAVFNWDDLVRFDAVVFLNVTGNSLSEGQRRAFRDWLQSGGAWLGVHAAGDGSHSYWPWYIDNLVGAEFTAHILGPQFQRARVNNEAPEHPLMAALPATWMHTEEWYSWREAPASGVFDILASIDESSYSPRQKILGRDRDLSMGYHPVVWARCGRGEGDAIGAGRALYSALGHGAEAYAEPRHRRLLESALQWLLDTGSTPCTPLSTSEK